MAARGQASKSAITEIILNTFMDSFINGKEIRIPMREDGEEVQIKITLTAAKDNVPHKTGGTPAPNPSAMLPKQETVPSEPAAPAVLEPTEEEKKSLEQLLSALM